MIKEINFDGLIGPSHNYAGLSLGNLASAKNAGGTSHPRAAALQGIAKMRANLDLGLTQGLFLPQRRPDRSWLRQLGTVPPYPGSPRTRNVTIKDIAREAEVSIASVSRVLNNVGRVSNATRARILNIAERLHYVPHEGARSLIRNRTATVGMVLPDLHGEFFSELLRGTDSAARALDMHLSISCLGCVQIDRIWIAEAG